MLDELGLTQGAPLSVPTLVVNLFLTGLICVAISWHYVRFGRTYANRAELAWVFPLVGLATVLVISVVKSSLALSLGLVGALSIVRFRTPIKEPEELAYLFLTIAAGVGLGADQRVPTVVAFLVIIGFATARALLSGEKSKHHLYMNVEVPQTDGRGENVFRQINGLLAEHVQVADMRRLDARDGMLQATYFIDCEDSDRLMELMDRLNGSLPGVGLSFVEQKGLPER